MIGVPHEWQMDFPASYTPVMDKVASLHDLLLVIISLISVFVLFLLLYAMWRFHASRNPTATVTPQHVPRDRLDDHPDPDPGGDRHPVVPAAVLRRQGEDAALTIKVTGHQWYWTTNIPTRATSRSRAAS